MSTPASIKGHPLHPMLVTIPIGLWVFSFVCDLLLLVHGNPWWEIVAFYTLAGGLVGALLAAVPGFIDFLSLKAPRARRIASIHLALNLTLVVVVALNVWARWNGVETAWPIAVSALTVAALVVSGWLGGELVHVLGVTVDDRARGWAPEWSPGIGTSRTLPPGVSGRAEASRRADAELTPKPR
jgi:uncharacterized membrane protein